MMWDFLQSILVTSNIGFPLVAVGLWIESHTGLPHFSDRG